jgi:hypothetical protein
LARMFRHYADVTGVDLDYDAIDYHTVEWSLSTSMSCVKVLEHPPLDIDYSRTLGWYMDELLLALQVIAARVGVQLEDHESSGPPVLTRYSSAFKSLSDNLDAIRPVDEFDDYQRYVASTTNCFLQTVGELGPSIERQDADELATLLGRRPTDWLDADYRLEQFVREAGSEADALLVDLLYRRVSRQRAILREALAKSTGRLQERAVLPPVVPLATLMGDR